VFGPRAKDNEDVRGMLNAGHRRGATAGRCTIKGKTVETEELPAYCAVALAGLDDLPDTLMMRSVIVRMRRRAPGESVEPWRLRVNGPDADALSDRLAAWGNENQHRLGITWPEMPAGIEDRNADVWEALLAIADHVGDGWPERARVAAVTLVTQAVDRAPTLGVTLLRDLRTIFDQLGQDKVATDVLLERLTELDESPWGDLRGRDLDARGLARRLNKYGIKPKVIRTPAGVIRGYERADMHDAWSRYLQRIPPTEKVKSRVVV
jgi:hypothetical protein